VNERLRPFDLVAAALLSIATCGTTGACANGAWHPRAVDDADEVQLHPLANVAAARELDQEGIRRFREGRYEDAIRYFREAHRLGGPSSELWNIARSREKLDDPEGACAAIDEYLAKRELLPQDRAEGEREARALRTRPSLLTVTTTPLGAFVTLDSGQVAGPTPVSIEVLPGRHAIAVRRDGYASETRTVDARFGRAIIVSLDLAPARH
jgi:tetratricopeptide (TPR) repeat protein